MPKIESLEDRCTPSILGSADFTSTPNGANFNYTIALNNTGTTNIGTFWFAWVPGQDYMANNPISVADPTGWTHSITGGFTGDGYAIRWIASSAPITPGNSLNFQFTSAETPSQLGGNSPFFAHPPEGTSFIYIGAPELDPGHGFVVKAATTTTLTDNGPNPSAAGQAVSFTATVSGGAAISGQTVFIEDADASNAVVASPTLSNGTVTFSISSLTVGIHHLFAVYSGDTTHDISNSSAAPVTQVVNQPPPMVSSVVVNGGTPQYVDSNGHSHDLSGQNSVVEQLLVTFNVAVTSFDSGAFSIVNNAAGVTVNYGAAPYAGAVSLNTPIQVGDGHQWILTFGTLGTHTVSDPGSGGIGNIINDGVYKLHTNLALVHAGAQTGTGSDDRGFWAMYGAVHDNTLSGTNVNIGTGFIGDGQSEVFLDASDFNDFKAWFNSGADSSSTSPFPYDVAMDYDLDGFPDANTFNAFKTPFNAGQDWTF